jgi:acyl-CoA thioester hydrolase
MSEKFKLYTDIQVRFSDTDGMGHVNNAMFLSYLEFARMHYWKELTGLTAFGQADFIMARVELDYRSPIMPGETVRAYIQISRIGGSSFDFTYRLEERDSKRLMASGKTVQASYDYAANKVKRITPELRKKIETLEGRTFS